MQIFIPNSFGMKKIFISLLIFILILPRDSFSQNQNVGIGTTTPVEKLEVKNALRSTLKISSNSYGDTTQLLLSNRAGTAGTDFSIKSMREEGLFFSSLSDLPQNNSSNSLVITPGGNIGVGIVPTTKFHVNGNSLFAGSMDVNGSMRLQNLNLFEFGAGVAGKETNAGKIGYNGFGTNALAIVGAGTNTTNRSVYFFAEGGIIMNGPLDIGGPLRISGNSGTAGQVLTSNGTGNPSWTNTAFSNNIRFFFDGDGLTTTNGSFTITTRYNTNTSIVSVSGTDITFNQTGIYHFDFAGSGYLQYSSPLGYEPHIYFSLDLVGGTGGGSNLIGDTKLSITPVSNIYKGSAYAGVDLYISAGQILRIHFNYDFAPGGYSFLSTGSELRGYLISN
jgi:hypothetical protein